MSDTLMAGFLPFEHEPYFDFARAEVAQAQRAAFGQVRERYVGRTFDLLIGGEPAQGDGTFAVCNPAVPGEALWHFQNATPAQLGQAVAGAQAAFETWRF